MTHVSDGASPGTPPEILASISVPDRVETVFGAFDFFDGMPLPDAVTRSYDALDLLRGIEVFLNCVPGASMVAMRRCGIEPTTRHSTGDSFGGAGSSARPRYQSDTVPTLSGYHATPPSGGV